MGGSACPDKSGSTTRRDRSVVARDLIRRARRTGSPLRFDRCEICFLGLLMSCFAFVETGENFINRFPKSLFYFPQDQQYEQIFHIHIPPTLQRFQRPLFPVDPEDSSRFSTR